MRRRLEKQAAADYEYSTLMRLLSVSVSKHLLDEHFTLIWANSFFMTFIGYSQEEFNTRFHNRPDEYFYNNPEGFQLLAKSVMCAPCQRGKRQFCLPALIHPDRGPTGETSGGLYG